jgi:recombination protein RecA
MMMASPHASNNSESLEFQDRRKALSLAMDAIERTHGKGSVMKLGDKTSLVQDVISTGALSLDIALGVGGLPRGRIIEIYGPESSGKTTLTLTVIAQTQKAGGMAAFIDAEHALDPEYAGRLGVNINDLLVSQPDSGEQALDITEQLVRSSALDLIVVDSVAALVPKAEIEGDMGDSHVGLQARLMSQALRKLTAVVNKTQTTVIFINQLRQKIGVMYGNPETTTGGNALKFYSSVRLDIRRIESLKKDGAEYGNRVKVKIVKNKVAPPFRIAEFDILFGEGISTLGCLIDVATDFGIIKRAGAWFSYNSERLGQGRDKVREFLRENPELVQEIDQKVRQQVAEQKAQALQQNQANQMAMGGVPTTTDAAMLAEVSG